MAWIRLVIRVQEKAYGLHFSSTPYSSNFQTQHSITEIALLQKPAKAKLLNCKPTSKLLPGMGNGINELGLMTAHHWVQKKTQNAVSMPSHKVGRYSLLLHHKK